MGRMQRTSQNAGEKKRGPAAFFLFISSKENPID